MSRAIRAVFFLWLLLASLVVVRAGQPAGRANPNPIHPAFVPLDAEGREVQTSLQPMSESNTCAECHDIRLIATHNSHSDEQISRRCLICHWDGDAIDLPAQVFESNGKLKREAILLRKPSDRSCGKCHGLVHTDDGPFRVPDDFTRTMFLGNDRGARPFDLTKTTGAIYSGQDVSRSVLNLAGKNGLDYPWDVHSRRLVACVDCHHSRNNPARTRRPGDRLPNLKADPRGLPIAAYLQAPDHRLSSTRCTDCHDASRTHAFLPYRDRHMEKLACTSCHIPYLYGPAASAVDATVVNSDGSPTVTYRGIETIASTLNATYGAGYSPTLLADPKSDGKVSPFNVVATWEWIDGSSRKAVPIDVIRTVYLSAGGYRVDVRARFDGDGDGALNDRELRLDTAEKAHFVRDLLQAAGVRDPKMRASVKAYRVTHGVVQGEQARRACIDCHSGNSRLSATLPLLPYLPGGVLPVSDRKQALGGAATLTSRNEVVWTPSPTEQLHVFGHARGRWAGLIGPGFLGIVVLLVAGHAAYRIYARRATGSKRTVTASTTKAYLFSGYERAWHWIMVLSVLVLLLTGLQIHFPDRLGLLEMEFAVRTHNIFAFILVANAFLALFYHLTTEAISQFLPSRRGFAEQLKAVLRYYLDGIFRGHLHPARTEDRKLNILQQISYLGLLNVLFPVQTATGLLIWGSSRWPNLAEAVGGLGGLAQIHSLGSWLFLAFLIGHIYLTTTGYTVFGNLKSMVDGYGDVTIGDHPLDRLGETQ